MKLDIYFPMPIWWEDYRLNNDEILNLCYRLREKDPKGRKISNVGGWQSNDIGPDEYEELKPLVDTIKSNSTLVLEQYGFDLNRCYLTIGNLWVNINNENDSNSIHTHTSCFLSGAYYVKASRSNSPIVFYKNFTEDFAITAAGPLDRYTQLSGSTARYQPKTGRLLMFPAWLPHGVLPNESTDERISIAFNMKMRTYE